MFSQMHLQTMGASEPDPPSQPQMRNTNSGQPSESFSYEHRRKLQNRLAQRRYRKFRYNAFHHVYYGLNDI